jgi:hypothetical protein
LIAELFNSPKPSKFIERIFVRQSVGKLGNEHSDWTTWGRALKASQRFAAAVSMRIVKQSSKKL